MTLGASGMIGFYDPQNKLTYAILGADFSLRIERTTFRLEYLVRRQEFDTSNPANLAYEIPPTGGNFYLKHGAYLEVEQPMTSRLDLIGRMDGMAHVGNVPASGPASTLTQKSGVIRETLGLAFAVERNLRLKMSGEYWQFSDRDSTGAMEALGIHMGVVGSF
jgi:hypothetical protein